MSGRAAGQSGGKPDPQIHHAERDDYDPEAARPSGELPDPRARGATASGATGGLIVAVAFAAVIAAGLWVVYTAETFRPVARPSPGAFAPDFRRPLPVGQRFVADPYVGSGVCAECHPGEAAPFSRTGHARTLRLGVTPALAKNLDGTNVADPEWPEVRWCYQYRDGQLHIFRNAPDQVENWIVDYAFGSGQHAVTFVSVRDPRVPSFLEHRLTYFRRTDALGTTPGHDTRPAPPGLTPHGGELPTRVGRECFRCHTTQISADDDKRLDLPTMIPNVSCERCHGPGRAHVAAARRDGSETDLALPFGLERWTAESLVSLCASCHRQASPATVSKVRPNDPALARFQPVGILQSLCYQKSSGVFSCVTCHDPHARASGDRPWYDTVCLSCHAARGEPAPKAIPPALPGDRSRPFGGACPRSPRAGCVECHMPRVDTGGGMRFSDHWIRVRRPAGPSSSAGTGVGRNP